MTEAPATPRSAAEALVEAPPEAPPRFRAVLDPGVFTGSGRPERVHVVPAGAVVPRGLRAPGPLLVGPGARIMGDVEARGAVHLAKGASVHGALRAVGDVVVGARAAVYGPLRAEGRVTLLANAVVAGELDAAADVTLREGARCASLLCGGDLVAAGHPQAREMRVRGQVRQEPPVLPVA